MAFLSYKAVGVVEGTFVPERDIVIGKDGTVYPATCLPSIRRFYEKKPEVAARVRFLVCYPRTSQTGCQIHLTVAVASADPERQASLKREAGRFTISGVITNQRSRLNRVVVRVSANRTVPRNQRHLTENKNHLIFLSGRAAPFCHFLNKHTSFTCELRGHQLEITGIEDTRELETITFSAGGLHFPWPFQATLKHVERFSSLNTKPGVFLVPEAPRDRLQLRLRQLDLLVQSRANLNSPVEQSETDRIAKIRRRIHTFTRRMGDRELLLLLESTGLLAAFAKLELTSANPTPEPAMPVTTASTVAIPKGLQKVAEQLCEGSPDALIAMSPGMNSKKARASIAALMATEGWWESLSNIEKARALRGSYQVRKAIKQLG